MLNPEVINTGKLLKASGTGTTYGMEQVVPDCPEPRWLGPYARQEVE